MSTAKKESLKATKAAKAPSPAKVLKLDAVSGELKAVPAKVTPKAKKEGMVGKPRTKAERKTDEALEAAALLAAEDLIGTPKKASKKTEERKAALAEVAPKPAAAPKTVSKYATQAEAVKAAIAADRGRTAVFEVNGSFLLGSRRRGLLKGWNYIGRAAALASKTTA